MVLDIVKNDVKNESNGACYREIFLEIYECSWRICRREKPREVWSKLRVMASNI